MARLVGYVKDDNYLPLRLDKMSLGLVDIDGPHHMIHEGKYYFIKTVLDVEGATGLTTYFTFTTPNNGDLIHAKARFDASVEFNVKIYEDAVLDASGTAMTAISNNRNSSTPAGLTAYSGPTVNTEGTLLWYGKTGDGRNSGVTNEFGYEILAKANTIYLFEIEKAVSANGWLDVDFFWYEYTPFET